MTLPAVRITPEVVVLQTYNRTCVLDMKGLRAKRDMSIFDVYR